MLLQETTVQGGSTPAEQGSPTWWMIFALIVVIIISVSLLVRVGKETCFQGKWSWLDYGNFYIVAFGIAAVLIGFLVILPFITPFDDKAQALGFLAALFGVITGLVGTFFGVKQSADAREGAQQATSDAVKNTAPTITIAPSKQTKPVNSDHEVTATVTSIDGSPAASAPVIFTITSGPDVGKASVEMTDASGTSTFEFTNNGTAGTDTIEVTSLRRTRTATVTFRKPRPWRRR